MKRSRFLAYVTGFGAALAKRTTFVLLFLIIFQLNLLQLRQDLNDDQTKRDDQARTDKTLRAIKSSQDQLKKDNQEQHRRTQQFLKCIVLIPLSQRTEANFARCGETGRVDPSIDDVNGSTGTPQTNTPSDTRKTEPPKQPPATAPEVKESTDDKPQRKPTQLELMLRDLFYAPFQLVESLQSKPEVTGRR